MAFHVRVKLRTIVGVARPLRDSLVRWTARVSGKPLTRAAHAGDAGSSVLLCNDFALQDARFERIPDQLGPAVQTQLAGQERQRGIDRLDTQRQSIGYLLVCVAAREQR